MPQSDAELFNWVIDTPKESDIPDIYAILEVWIRDRITHELLPDEVQSVIDRIEDSIKRANNYNYLVARNNEGKVIGIIGMRTPPEEQMLEYISTSIESCAELINAYVHPDYRKGKGVGKTLIYALLNLAKNKGYSEVIFNSGPRYKETAWDFYNKIIGQPVAFAKGYYSFNKQVNEQDIEDGKDNGDAPIWRALL